MAKQLSSSLSPGAKRHTSRLTAIDRAQVFKEDFYAEDGLLFCRFCCHTVDYIRKDTVKDHIRSKKYTQRKEAASKAASKQVTLPGMSARTESGEARERFTVECLVHADVPLEKAVKFKWLLEKYTSQGGTVPEGDTLRREYLPYLLPPHKESLKMMLAEKRVLTKQLILAKEMFW